MPGVAKAGSVGATRGAARSGTHSFLVLGLFARGTVVLSHQGDVFLGLVHDDVVWKWNRRAHLALWVVRQHDLDLDAKHALSHGDVPHGRLDVVVLGVTRGDEVAVLELHRLRALRAQLAADNDLD